MRKKTLADQDGEDLGESKMRNEMTHKQMKAKAQSPSTSDIPMPCLPRRISRITFLIESAFEACMSCRRGAVFTRGARNFDCFYCCSCRSGSGAAVNSLARASIVAGPVASSLAVWVGFAANSSSVARAARPDSDRDYRC